MLGGGTFLPFPRGFIVHTVDALRLLFKGLFPKVGRGKRGSEQEGKQEERRVEKEVGVGEEGKRKGGKAG